MSFLKKKKKVNHRNVPKGKGKVILNKKVYRTIIASCVRYANARIPEEDWLEIYGILIGHLDNDNDAVIVSEAYPITHTMKKQHILKVSYDSPDYVHTVAIEEEAYTHDPPEFIVGWYHSHPGIKVMFSQDDIKNQLFWQQANPKAIGLVFNQVRLVKQIEKAARKGDPNTQLQLDPGFKIFKLQDPNKGIEASYEWLDYEFADAELNNALINEAKDFVGDVTRLLPKDNLVESTRENINKKIDKIKEIYSGTESYIATLIKKGQTSRIANVIDTQKAEIDRIAGPTEVDVKKLTEMMHYVEYKEKEEIIKGLTEIFDRWHQEAADYVNRFQNLKATY